MHYYCVKYGYIEKVISLKWRCHQSKGGAIGLRGRCHQSKGSAIGPGCNQSAVPLNQDSFLISVILDIFRHIHHIYHKDVFIFIE